VPPSTLQTDVRGTSLTDGTFPFCLPLGVDALIVIRDSDEQCAAPREERCLQTHEFDEIAKPHDNPLTRRITTTGNHLDFVLDCRWGTVPNCIRKILGQVASLPS
jgi:hypothetical protein